MTNPKRLQPHEDHLRLMIPKASDMGPAMSKLEEREQVFVMCCVHQGSRVNGARAAKSAGYGSGESPNAIKAYAYTLLHKPKIQEALLEETKKRLNAAVIQAAGVLVEVMEDKHASAKDKLKAAEMVLDRGGLPARSEHHVIKHVQESREDKLLKLANLAKQLGMNPKDLIGNLADAIPGDFKVVEKAGQPVAEVEDAEVVQDESTLD